MKDLTSLLIHSFVQLQTLSHRKARLQGSVCSCEPAPMALVLCSVCWMIQQAIGRAGELEACGSCLAHL